MTQSIKQPSKSLYSQAGATKNIFLGHFYLISNNHMWDQIRFYWLMSSCFLLTSSIVQIFQFLTFFINFIDSSDISIFDVWHVYYTLKNICWPYSQTELGLYLLHTLAPCTYEHVISSTGYFRENYGKPSAFYRIWLGGPSKYLWELLKAWSATVWVKWENIIGKGQGPALGPWKLLLFKCQMGILPPFLVPFLQNFQLIIYVGTWQNMYVSMTKDSNFLKMKYSFQKMAM